MQYSSKRQTCTKLPMQQRIQPKAEPSIDYNRSIAPSVLESKWNHGDLFAFLVSFFRSLHEGACRVPWPPLHCLAVRCHGLLFTSFFFFTLCFPGCISVCRGRLPTLRAQASPSNSAYKAFQAHCSMLMPPGSKNTHCCHKFWPTK